MVRATCRDAAEVRITTPGAFADAAQLLARAALRGRTDGYISKFSQDIDIVSTVRHMVPTPPGYYEWVGNGMPCGRYWADANHVFPRSFRYWEILRIDARSDGATVATDSRRDERWITSYVSDVPSPQLTEHGMA